MPPTQPHDAFFRSLIAAPSWADKLIRQSLPPGIVALLPDETFAVVEGSFVDDELRITRADGVFSTRFRDGRMLYILFEHKSTPDAGTPLQIAEYMLRIWRNHEHQEAGVPLIIPTVVYHGPAPWRVPRSIRELTGRFEDPFHLYDPIQPEGFVLVQTPYPELSPDEDVRAGLVILKDALIENPSRQNLLEAARILGRGDLKLKSSLASYMVETHNLTREDLERILRAADPELWETVMPSVAEAWRQEAKAEAMAEGRAEGKAEGRAEGKAETLLRQLERRFGAVPEDARARVLAAPVGDLDAWLDAILSASSLDDVFTNGAIH